MEMRLVAKGIVKYYKELKVLDGIDLTIGIRESIGLYGPNACGKTTLLKILADIVKPEEGEIVRFGTVSMVFQDDKMIPWMDLVNNVAILLRLKGVNKSKALKEALEKLKQLEIDKYSKMKPSQLSGGTIRKASIARALTLDPDILLLDEPFTGIDESSRSSIKDLIRSLINDHKISIVLTSHYIDDFKDLVDKILFMSRSPARIIKIETITSSKSRT